MCCSPRGFAISERARSRSATFVSTSAANPYPESHPKHVGFRNRVQYVNYEGRTKSISLLGYVIPREKADARKHRYSSIGAIPALADLFQAGESLAADDLLIRAPGETESAPRQ